ncbi:hypothetical protein WBN84_05700 [Pseudoxanthomonas sp. CCNWLY206]
MARIVRQMAQVGKMTYWIPCGSDVSRDRKPPKPGHGPTLKDADRALIVLQSMLIRVDPCLTRLLASRRDSPVPACRHHSHKEVSTKAEKASLYKKLTAR